MVASSAGTQAAPGHPAELVEVAPGAPGGVQPAERVLHAVDEQGRHGDRDRDQQPAGNQEPAAPQAVARRREDHGIEDGDCGESGAAQARERESREQAHGADHDQGAGVPEQVHEVEARPHRRIRRRRLRAQDMPERVRLLGRDHAGRHRPLEIVAPDRDRAVGRGSGLEAHCHVHAVSDLVHR
jgi:hypothetical protein